MVKKNFNDDGDVGSYNLLCDVHIQTWIQVYQQSDVQKFFYIILYDRAC